MPDQSSEVPKELVEEVSYKKIMAFIAKHHPFDSTAKQKFSVMERVTVRDYFLKLLSLENVHKTCWRIKMYAKYRWKGKKDDQIKDIVKNMKASGCKSGHDDSD
jgi:hypothetical protein